MSQKPPARNDLTLRGRGGLRLTLFAPRTRPDGALEADALYVSGPVPPGRIFRWGDHKVRAPGIPGPAFHLARITLPEVP